VWGFHTSDDIKRLNLKYCKIIVNIKKSTPSSAIYGELSRLPLKTIRTEQNTEILAKNSCAKVPNCLTRIRTFP